MAVAHDASNNAYNGAPSGTMDFTNLLTVGSGSNRALVVGLVTDSQTTTITSVTWDQGGTNQAMTSIVGPINAGASPGRVWLYGLVAPTSGLHTLRVVVSTIPNEIFVFAESVTGADQTGGTTTFAHSTSNTGNSNTGSVTITSATGNMTVELTSGPQVMSAPTQTQIFVDNAGANTSAGASRAAGAASSTHQWTFAGAVQWVAAGLDIAAAASGSSSVSPSISPSPSASISLSPSLSPSPSSSVSSSPSPSAAGSVIVERTVFTYVD